MYELMFKKNYALVYVKASDKVVEGVKIVCGVGLHGLESGVIVTSFCNAEFGRFFVVGGIST